MRSRSLGSAIASRGSLGVIAVSRILRRVEGEDFGWDRGRQSDRPTSAKGVSNVVPSKQLIEGFLKPHEPGDSHAEQFSPIHAPGGNPVPPSG
jgi:hypothetical protein